MTGDESTECGTRVVLWLCQSNNNLKGRDAKGWDEMMETNK